MKINILNYFNIKSFFKIRYIFSILKPINGFFSFAESSNIIIIDNFENIKNIYLQFLLKYIDYNKIKSRLLLPYCCLFLVIKHNQAIGFCWAIMAKDNSLWHDNFCLMPGEGLIFNAYIETIYRGSGIYQHLLRIISDIYFYNFHCLLMHLIIEKQNTAALKASIKSGFCHTKKNYLIKFFKYNILSIYIKRGIKVYYVHNNPKGYNI